MAHPVLTPSRGQNPLDGVFQAGPMVFNKTGFAGGEVFAKYLIGIAANAALDQKAGEMGARDQIMIAGKFECPFISACYSRLGQGVGHFHGPLTTAAPGLLESNFESQVFDIKTQTDDMNCLMQKAD